MRRWAALLLLGIAAGAAAQELVRARQNIDYRLIEPQPVATGERIEVIDFFWYGCPHCDALQPALERWIRRKPPDVALRRIPAILNESWVPHARIYYTLERLNELERLHLKVYHSYHVERMHLGKPEVAAEWAVRNGIDRRAWLEAYFSPEVERQIERARRATRDYRVEGTPTLVVDGRFLTSGALAPSLEGMIPVLEDLIRLARHERGRR